MNLLERESLDSGTKVARSKGSLVEQTIRWSKIDIGVYKQLMREAGDQDECDDTVWIVGYHIAILRNIWIAGITDTRLICWPCYQLSGPPATKTRLLDSKSYTCETYHAY